MSSAAVLEPKPTSQAVQPQFAVVEAQPDIQPAANPMVVVSIAIVIALVGAVTFVGSIIVWLMIRDSGVAHPLF
jgi:hypothetical protein